MCVVAAGIHAHGGVTGHMWWLMLQLLTVNQAFTPGVVVVPPITVAQVCGTKWGRDTRHVTAKMKRTVAQRYGLSYPVPFPIEYDHKVPRELGGADDVDNLWPEPLADAVVKNRYENSYHRAVCRGEMSLAAAQAFFLHWGQ